MGRRASSPFNSVGSTVLYILHLRIYLTRSQKVLEISVLKSNSGCHRASECQVWCSARYARRWDKLTQAQSFRRGNGSGTSVGQRISSQQVQRYDPDMKLIMIACGLNSNRFDESIPHDLKRLGMKISWYIEEFKPFLHSDPFETACCISARFKQLVGRSRILKFKGVPVSHDLMYFSFACHRRSQLYVIFVDHTLDFMQALFH